MKTGFVGKGFQEILFSIVKRGCGEERQRKAALELQEDFQVCHRYDN